MCFKMPLGTRKLTLIQKKQTTTTRTEETTTTNSKKQPEGETKDEKTAVTSRSKESVKMEDKKRKGFGWTFKGLRQKPATESAKYVKPPLIPADKSDTVTVVRENDSKVTASDRATDSELKAITLRDLHTGVQSPAPSQPATNFTLSEPRKLDIDVNASGSVLANGMVEYASIINSDAAAKRLPAFRETLVQEVMIEDTTAKEDTEARDVWQTPPETRRRRSIPGKEVQQTVSVSSMVPQPMSAAKETLPQQVPDMPVDPFCLCTVCKEVFKQPKILPCLHVFCRDCLIAVTGPCALSTMMCPICQEQISMPGDGVDGFMDSYFTADVVATSLVTKTTGVWYCDVCAADGDHIEAVARCQECGERMCQSCTRAHRRMKATSSHQVVNIDKEGEGSVNDNQPGGRMVALCPDHRVPVTLYCMSCEVPACVRCMVSQHNGHKTKDVDTVAEQKRSTLRDIVRVVKEKTGQLQHLTSSTRELQQGLEDHVGQQVYAIDEKRREVMHIVTKITEGLKNAVHSKLTAALRMVALHLEDCDMQLRTFKTTTELGERLLSQGGSRDIVLLEREFARRMTSLDARLKAIHSSPITDYVEGCKVVFITGVTGEVELKHFVGDLHEESENIVNMSRMGKSIQQMARKNSATDESRPVVLHKVEQPWQRFYIRDPSTYQFMSPEKIKEELFFRKAKAIINKLTLSNLNTHMTQLFDLHINSEAKLGRLMELVVDLASRNPAFGELCALLCRCLSFIQVPSRVRQGDHCTVHMFLNRVCQMRFESAKGKSLSESTTELYRTASFRGSRASVTGAVGLPSNSQPGTPAVTRSATFNYGSRTLDNKQTPIAENIPVLSTFGKDKSNPFGRDSNNPFPKRSTSTSPETPNLFERNPWKLNVASHDNRQSSDSQQARQPQTGSHEQSSSLLRRGTRKQATELSKQEGPPKDPDAELENFSRRYHNIGIILFLCELFKMRLITENIIHDWIQKLVKLDNDIGLECVCAILHGVGRYIDHENSKAIVNKYFSQLNYLVFRKGASVGRLSSMVKDILDLRAKSWEPQRCLKYWELTSWRL